MIEFKVGDVVRTKKYCSGVDAGDIATIIFDEDKLWAQTERCKLEDNHGCSCQDNWILVKNNRITELRKRIIK